MGHRAAMKLPSVLPFENRTCRIEGVVGRGSNVLLYRGTCPENGGEALVLELFPSHPQGQIFRDPEGTIRAAQDAEDFLQTHLEYFMRFPEVHGRRLADHPELTGYAMQTLSWNGTRYLKMPFPQGKSLAQAWAGEEASLLCHTRRMLSLLDALEAYHKCGYLHLDITPDQILLSRQDDLETVFLLQNNLRDPAQPDTGGKYRAPEVESGYGDMADFSSDLYSVTAVFFHSLMGRPMTLEEMLASAAPSVRDSSCVCRESYPVRQMISRILKKGLHVLPGKRYRSVGQMRQAFRELEARILSGGVTHWSLWENGKRGTEDWIRSLTGEGRFDPALKLWLQQGKRRSAAVSALVRVKGEACSAEDPQSLRRAVLQVLQLPLESVEFLDRLLEKPLESGEPVLLLVLEGMGNLPELRFLREKKGLRLLDSTGNPL